MDQTNNIRAIDSIIKARDDNTTNYDHFPSGHLYSLMLSHIENIQTNLYNFKFIARLVDPECTKEIYLNLQILINDSSLATNSKYYINDQSRLKLVNSYRFGDKEKPNNSFRVDFSINKPNNPDDLYLKLELVNMASNTSCYVGINKEIFFKISIFLYQLLTYNIIDGDIFIKKINSFRLLVGKDAFLSSISDETKLFTLYWNTRYIICFLESSTDSNNLSQITYGCFTKEEYENLF